VKSPPGNWAFHAAAVFVHPLVVDTRLANLHRPHAGQNAPPGHRAVANDQPPAGRVAEIVVGRHVLIHLVLNRLGEHSLGALMEDLGQNVCGFQLQRLGLCHTLLHGGVFFLLLVPQLVQTPRIRRRAPADHPQLSTIPPPRHHYNHPGRVDRMVACLTQPPLRIADHLQEAKASLIQYLQEAKASLIQYLAGSLLGLKAEIAQREKAITESFHQLPEADWVESLPGAGSNLAPAIPACIGRDQERFETPADAQAFMGTAPVTRAGGNSRSVSFRRGCWKFARRTLQLFADQSRRQCAWAERFYQKQRDSGHKHHQALRALAHKWVKILLAMQRTGSPYIEAVFVESQQRYLSKGHPSTTHTRNSFAPTLP